MSVSQSVFHSTVEITLRKSWEQVLFLIDECTDVEPEPVVRKMMDVVIDTLKNPDKPRPQGEIVLGEMTRQ